MDAAREHLFPHRRRSGSSANQRMRDAGFDFSGAWQSAENLAVQSERGAAGIMDDVQDLHVPLMDSPGHRANILDPALDYVGIGVERGNFSFSSGTYQSVIVTQTFAATGGTVDLDTGAADDDGPVMDSDDEVVTGTGADDNLEGGGGNDTLSGNAGNDLLRGGADDDLLERRLRVRRDAWRCGP
ncbi:CAP domain-containing protein [Rhodophyticola sp.]|uniref:CAP domain-containing protein n=1 Tax=Rhodophyticola sp. TaxID=2680032 RepID=UPI003D265AE6